MGLCHMLLKSKMERRLHQRNETTRGGSMISALQNETRVKMYSVLMGIHQNFKAIIATLDQNSNRIIDIFIIIDTPTFNSASENTYNNNNNKSSSRSFVFQSFPAERESQNIKTPTFKPSQMNVRTSVIQVERTTKERKFLLLGLVFPSLIFVVAIQVLFNAFPEPFFLPT